MAWGFAVLPSVEALAQADNGAGALELVDPNVFRACGDPRNLPFSNEKGEGFENKLAELFAAKLGKKLSYTYFPQATGFVSKTLGSYRCDVIIGISPGRRSGAGDGPLLSDNLCADRQAPEAVLKMSPRSAIRSSGTSGLESSRETPPSTYMALNGLLAQSQILSACSSIPAPIPRRRR